MSRIGKKAMTIPEAVEVIVNENVVTVKGPLGELKQDFMDFVHVNVDNEAKTVQVTVDNPESKKEKAFWGLYARLIENMMKGVKEGFNKVLEVNGVGYRVELKGDTLVLHLGFSHPVEFKVPKDVKASVEGNKITITGIDKQRVGQVAANIRALKKPEPYKGKGIKYIDEVIRRKAGKTGAK